MPRKKLSKFNQRRQKLASIAARKSAVEPLEQRELLTVSTFQNGVSGYNGQGETVLYSREPGANFGGESSMSPDQQDANGVRQGLLRFDDIIGAGAIPLGAKINSATFNVNVINDSNSAMQMSLYRLQHAWGENLATWNQPFLSGEPAGEIGGVQASEGEASSLPPDGILFQADTSASGKPGTGTFDVTRSLEYWVTGAENNGWLIESAATNGWDYTTSEAATPADRPQLIVDWDIPSTNEFKVLSQNLVAAEGESVKVDIARFGDLSDAASINYSITAGTAGSGDFVASSGTIEFGAGEAFTQVDLSTIEDGELEGDETVIFTLGGEAGASEVLWTEDFEGVTLGPSPQERPIPPVPVWTATPPAGWTVDNSGVPGIGDPESGVEDWEGWTFANKAFWTETAGDQRRAEFVLGDGVVAVADPDEWDDIGAPADNLGFFNAFLETPEVNLGGSAATITFASSWRDEAFDDDGAPGPEDDNTNNQTATLSVSYDGGEYVEILRWESDPNSPNFKDDAPNETVTLSLAAANTAKFQFGLTQGGNDWWWAVDNIEVATSAALTGGVETTIKIGDDDALINEVFANVSNNNADETNQEYIELIGTPGASLDGYTFVVFEGEEEEVPTNATKDGAGAGVADFVFDLSGQSFGDNGLLVIAPTDWAFAGLADAETNIVNTSLLDGEGGVLEDHSQTYALFRGGSFTAGVDYDTEGVYEDETNQAVGEGVGVLDQLPAGTSMVDSVGTVEGGGSDRDRTLTTPDLDHPGVHVHQPERNRSVSSNGVTSDAISRRLGVAIPNSIGVWYNGDVLDSDPAGTLAYANDTFWTSVVTPDGAVLTPGAPNQLRTVYFSQDSQNAVVDEAAGTVTLTIERVGAADEAITASYIAVDTGSAAAGSDFTAAAAEVSFAAGEFSKTVEIPILSDDAAEGFESFRVEITSVTDGYLITNGRATESGAVNGEATVTISDGDVELGVFQDDNDAGYDGTTDGHLDAHLPSDKFGQDLVVRVDNNKGEFGDEVFLPQQGLLKFDDLNSVVPAGSTVFSGFVTLNVIDGSGGDVSLYRMLQPWDQVQTSWEDPQGDEGDSIADGITPDDVEAVAVADAVVPDASRTGKVQVPLNAATLQSWVNGSMPNYGWQIVNSSGELYAFSSSEAFALDGQGLSVKPELTIVYNPPSGSGTFAFGQDDFVVAEGGSATITVNRVGGTSGATSVDWSIGQSTGGLDDISSAASGTLSFADGELFKTFTVATVDDSDVETNEDLVLTVGDASTTLTIRDNDFDASANTLLLSEMFINSPGNDPPSEFIELTGDAGLNMGSFYYIAVEGEAGDTEGLAEKVIDIGAFSNGQNGHTILTPDAPDFANNVPSGATQIDQLGSIATENVSSANNTTTFMLVYSPEQRIAEFDYDWNNDGVLELPASAVIVDSIAFDSSSDDTDLTYTPGGSEVRNAGALDVDALSRKSGNTDANDADAWYGGDLVPAGDDYILYEASESFGVPANGTLTPGEANTAAGATQATVVSVDGATGFVSVTFSEPVSQVLLGLGTSDAAEGAGITISAAGGAPAVGVDAVPVVESGFDTNTLVLSFTGSNTNNGAPPAGDYQLNIVGNGLVSNGLSVDAGASGVSVLTFSHDGGAPDVPGRLAADFNSSGATDFADFLILSANFAGEGAFEDGDATGDGLINFADFLILSAEFGQTAAAVDAVFAGA